jgi:hypothetical protein
MEFRNVTFYNHFGNGDLWISREFVKQITELISADNYYYAHAKDHHLLFDLPYIKKAEITDICNMREPYVLYGDSIYINTWLGYAYGKYVFPNVTLSIANMKRMFNDTLSYIGINYRFNATNFNYVPRPDYAFIEDGYITNINKFILNNIQSKLVLISNGNVQSNQASNFDFKPIINNLANKHINTIFLVTENYEEKPDNVLYAGDIIKKTDGSDLPEISYFSQFVDLIVGRSSGPYVYAQTTLNYSNPDMSIIGFTYEHDCAHMLNQTESRAKLYWDDTSNPVSIENRIEELLHE